MNIRVSVVGTTQGTNNGSYDYISCSRGERQQRIFASPEWKVEYFRGMREKNPLLPSLCCKFVGYILERVSVLGCNVLTTAQGVIIGTLKKVV